MSRLSRRDSFCKIVYMLCKLDSSRMMSYLFCWYMKRSSVLFKCSMHVFFENIILIVLDVGRFFFMPTCTIYTICLLGVLCSPSGKDGLLHCNFISSWISISTNMADRLREHFVSRERYFSYLLGAYPFFIANFRPHLPT